jgi:hypothetical protein
MKPEGSSDYPSESAARITDILEACECDGARLAALEQQPHWNKSATDVHVIIGAFDTAISKFAAFEILSRNPANGPMHNTEKQEAHEMLSHPSDASEPLPGGSTAACSLSPPQRDDEAGAGRSGACLVCLSTAATRIAIPCGHVSHCEACEADMAAKKANLTTCFVCRQSVVQFIKMLFP